ncbi:hypothetical protein NHJ13051_006908 [Beauveria bassiana]
MLTPIQLHRDAKLRVNHADSARSNVIRSGPLVLYATLAVKIASIWKTPLETVTTTLLQKFEDLSSELASLRNLLQTQDQAEDASFKVSERMAAGHTSSSIDIASQAPQPQEPSRDFLQIPQHPASADTVLCWEIFEDRFPANALIGSLFKPKLADMAEDVVAAPSRMMPLDEENIPVLIDKFLQNVHTKNPILDVESLVKHGRRCADQGIGWDGRSCLVLLACALGSIVKPFNRPIPQTAGIYFGKDESTGEPMASSSRMYAKELQQADSCFVLACRRLGSLKYSLIGAQCHFFAGVFFQVHLRMTHGIAGDFEDALNAASSRSDFTTRKLKRLEQSLYWSAFKSECEFRVELPLQQSEISLGEYPDLFPSPPSPIPTNSSDDDGVTGGNNFTSTEDLELRQHAVRLCNEEESWYYYLTEIALRRIGNRTSAESLGSVNGIPELDNDEVELLHSLVASGIECCLKTIDVRSRGHRHHGLWYDLRSIMTASLVLLAIIKSGQAAWIPGGTDAVWGVTSQQYWPGNRDPIGGKIGKVLTQFEFWAEESPDLVRYKEILEHLHANGEKEKESYVPENTANTFKSLVLLVPFV